jgi:CheY-like chemotaxis protein
MANSKRKLTKLNYDGPVLVLCDESLRSFFTSLIKTSPLCAKRVEYVYGWPQLREALAAAGARPGLILVDATVTWDERLLQDFYGFDVAARLRRDFSVKAPVIFLSILKEDSFKSLQQSGKKYALLKSVGSGFLQLPCTPDELAVAASTARPLSDAELAEVVINDCGLLDEWRATAHKIGNALAHYESSRQEIIETTVSWARTIDRFAPAHGGTLVRFKRLLERPPALVSARDLKRALEELDASLCGVTSDSDGGPEYGTAPDVPRCPPSQFKKILIADDEPQPFLINTLRNQYGYTVLEQAYQLSRAIELLSKEKPDVILSDYYFKESSRKTEVPDKSVGDRFILHALRHPQYAGAEPKKPIVLVTSKATLRADAEIRDGAINCSGANRATDPAFIHGVIWAEARRRGVSEPEELGGQEWALDHTCRRRLEQYVEDLPQLIAQWGEFRGTVRDTLALSRLLAGSASDDDPGLVRLLIETLEPYEMTSDFSLGAVLDIFEGTGRVHRLARSAPGPESAAGQAVRNILHGKIEQFSSVSNAVRTLVRTLPDLSRDLMSLPRHRQAGVMITELLDSFAESAPLSPFLERLREVLAGALRGLPDVPPPPEPAPRKEVGESSYVEVVVVEDNDYWREFLVRAIQKTRSVLGGQYGISYRCFDNAADALASVPPSSKSFAIDGTNQSEAKTVVIADICLPKNREHAESIRGAAEGRLSLLETPHSTHGLSLIRRLCGYRYNVPLIIFSTVDSIADRKTIGSWGVPDEDFLAKDLDAEEALVRALIRKIEKKTKYVLKRYEGGGEARFWINGVEIPFTEEIRGTFAAFYGLCQSTGRRSFSAREIAEARWGVASEEAVKTVQDQMYKIRKQIFETLRTNRVFVKIRELIRTGRSFDDEFTYELNAELTPPGEEEDYETDVEFYRSERCKVLVVENDDRARARMSDILVSAGYEVRHATNVEDAVSLAKEFLPHVISLDLQLPRTRAEGHDSFGDERAGLDAWERIRTALGARTIGVVVPTVNVDKNYLVAKAAQMEIPVRNFISKSHTNWLGALLQKVGEEKARVLLGEMPDASRDFQEPVVEILDGSDLPAGVLRLAVNGSPFTMRRGAVSRIIGHLLAHPRTLQSPDRITAAAGKASPGTGDDFKNWTRRIRGAVSKDWLASAAGGGKELAEKILESSLKGMRLNVQVIDRRVEG